MDVGIRIANIVLAVDLFRALGTPFDKDLEVAVAHAVVDHGRFLCANLEFNDRFRGNHYLADIVGLLFAGAALQPDDESQAWLDFAEEELFNEAPLQFDRDGVNAEGSTSYHRLSAELLTYGTALVLGISTSRRRCSPPASLAALLEGAARFTEACTAPNGSVVQIGDNDSGRLFQFTPSWSVYTVGTARERFANLASYDALPDDAPHPIADSLDHRHLLASIGALCPTVLPAQLTLRQRLEHHIVTALTRGQTLESRGSWRPNTTIGAATPQPAGAGENRLRRIAVVPGGSGFADNASVDTFPGFGLAVVRTERLFLAFRCGPLGQNGRGGHAHNDQLGLELWIDGEPWVRDPGTFTYTADPMLRNRYRSARAHAVPAARAEPYSLDVDLFALHGPGDGGHLLFARPAQLIGEFEALTGRSRRVIRVLDDRLVIDDTNDLGAPRDLTVRTPQEALDALVADPLPFSPGYGWQLR